jgi:HK97 family phage prohead protease
MPMGPYKDFSACLIAQGKKGRNKASASRICGEIKARTEGTKKFEKSDMNFNFEKYLPISKVNEDERMVYGYASTPDLDSQGEVVELEAIKKALPSYMKFPTIREMHTTNAVGRTKSAKVDDKGLFIQAKIVDDNAWKKVKEGVFNGFSIGGKAVQMVGNTIKELRLTEISLVDVPANKSAVITLFKKDTVAKSEEVSVKSEKSELQKSYEDYLVKFAFNWEEVSQLQEKIKKQEEIVEEVKQEVKQPVVEEQVVEQGLSADEIAEVEQVLSETTEEEIIEALKDLRKNPNILGLTNKK